MGISLQSLFKLKESLEERVKIADTAKAARAKEWEETCVLAIELNEKHGITFTCGEINVSAGKVTVGTIPYPKVIPTEELLNKFKLALQENMTKFIEKL